MQIILVAALAVSVIGNLVLAYFFYKKPKRKESVELTEFLSDLTRGSSLVRVSRVDPAEYFLKSSRDRI